MKKIYSFLLFILLFISFSVMLFSCGDKKDKACKHPNIVTVNEVSPTYETSGVRTHFKCSDCDEIFYDAKGNRKADLNALFIPKLVACKHSLSHVSATKADNFKEGNIEYYVCRLCHKYFADEEALVEITQEDTIIPIVPLCNHDMIYHEKVNATSQTTGTKAHYECSLCHQLFTDSLGYYETSLNDLVIDVKIPEDCLSLTYTFTGKEKDVKGYAEGTILLTTSEGFDKGEQYAFYFGCDNDPLEKHYPLYDITLEKNSRKITFDIDENILIPSLATEIVVYHNGKYANSFPIDSSKLLTDTDVTRKFAVISDPHMNIPQGKLQFLSALDEFEKQGIEYVIMSGDIGETIEDYNKYRDACMSSIYTGLIFTSIGNHDQKSDLTESFYRSVAVYDGSTKKFINIKDVSNYFANEYSKKLPVTAYFEDIEGYNTTNYFYVTVDNNLYFFMDQMVTPGESGATEDNFSKLQLDHLENTLYKYSSAINTEYDKYNLFIVEHAPIKDFKVGDMFEPHYGGQLKLDTNFENNCRFASILQEYYEAILITGHTHIRFDDCINYVDRLYNSKGELTNSPLARTLHVPSVSQPRYYDYIDGKWKLQFVNNYSIDSECYFVYLTDDNIIFEGNKLKEVTPGVVEYNKDSYNRHVFSKYSYIIPTINNDHYAPLPNTELVLPSLVDTLTGSPVITPIMNGISFKVSTPLDGFMFKANDLSLESLRDAYITVYMLTDATSFDICSADYNKNITKSLHIDLTKETADYYVIRRDGMVAVQVRLNAIYDASLNSSYAIGFKNFDKDCEVIVNSVKVSLFKDIKTRGTSVFAGTDFTQTLGNSYLKHLSFDYRIDNEGVICMAIMDSNWSKYYGYFKFTNKGEYTDYKGITVSDIGDGYLRVVLNFDEIDFTGNTSGRSKAPVSVDIFYVRKDLTTADSYIDNIKLY